MLKSIFKYGMLLSVFLLIFIWGCNFWITNSTKADIYDDVKLIPENRVALVLGTNPVTRFNQSNPYFNYRIQAAWELYKNRKVKHFILSGDNHRNGYNEPEEMKLALMKKGVPESAIHLDYAGFRTLDSIVRGKEIFQQQKITVVSQQFHNHRALFIARKKGITAIAYNAEDPLAHVKSKTKFREYLARCKAVLDLYVFNKQPKFLGEKIAIK